MNMSRTTLAMALAGIMLQGCGADEKDRPAPTVSSTAIFAPATAMQVAMTPEDDGSPGDFLPFPTNIFFNGTADGTVNITGKPNSDVATTPPAIAFGDPQTALNTMDGFSTVANMVVRFSGAVDPATTNGGIRLFKAGSIDVLTKTVTSIDSELIYGVDFVASVSQGTTGLIVPLRPFESGATYLVVVTDDLRTTTGEAVTADPEYQLLKSSDPLPAPYAALEPLRVQTNMHEGLIAAFTSGNADPTDDLTSADISLSYNVSMQNVTAPMAAAKAQIDGATAPDFSIQNPISVWDGDPNTPGEIVSPGTNGVPDGADDHDAHIYTGVMTGMTQFVDLSQPNTTVWQNSGENLSPLNGYAPDVVGTEVLPVLVSTPRPEMIAPGGDCETINAATGLPVVIFQHGITANRGSLMGLADTLAKACLVGVAIDLPKHGIRPDDSTFGALSLGAAELLVTSSAPDGENPAGSCTSGVPYDVSGGGDWRCPSGENFINLTNLANARDMMRQAVMNLHSVYDAVAAQADGGTLETATAVNIDPNNIHFVGMSLGGIVGTAFVAQEPGVQTATINASGGGIAKILDGSPTIEPQITAGLAQNGVTKPGGTYEGFLIIAQTMVDSVDPINYVEALNSNGTPVLMQEVIGDGDAQACLATGEGCPDMVVPNNVFMSLGYQWGIVAQTGQVGYLPGQDPLTVPSALAGTDPLAQGTAFVALAEQGILGNPLFDLSVAGIDAFYGLGLEERGAAGCTPGDCSGVVRFTAGEHSSLLDPTPSMAVTTAMQAQLATFIGTHVQTGGAATSLPPVDGSVVRQ